MPNPAHKYGYDRHSLRYRDLTTGRFVAAHEVQRGANDSFRAGERRLRDLAARLADGKLNLTAWRDAMVLELRRQHVTAAALANGGWAQMNGEAWLRVARSLKAEFRYLDGFALEIARRRNPADLAVYLQSRQFRTRVASYTGQVRRRYAEELLRAARVAQRAGYESEGRRVLHPADHCAGCAEEAARGWVTVAEVAPIGTQECFWFCRCELEFRIRKVNEHA